MISLATNNPSSELVAFQLLSLHEEKVELS